jgi:hypothetical protein
LSSYLGPNSRLSGAQKAFIDSVRRDLPNFFSSVPHNDPRLSDRFAAAIRMFGKARAAEIFGKFDVVTSAVIDRDEPSFRSELTQFARAVRARAQVRGVRTAAIYAAVSLVPGSSVTPKMRAAALIQDDCNCNTGADFCNIGLPTGPDRCTFNGCVIYGLGCGWLGWGACNGWCRGNDS